MNWRWVKQPSRDCLDLRAGPRVDSREDLDETSRLRDSGLGHDMSRLQTPVRRNDTVIVITGKNRGKRGRVLKLLPDRNRVIVEGVNFIKRHTRPNLSRNIKGGVVEREASLHASNLQIVCPECGAQTRIGRRLLGDGRKVRICRKCEGVVDR